MTEYAFEKTASNLDVDGKATKIERLLAISAIIVAVVVIGSLVWNVITLDSTFRGVRDPSWSEIGRHLFGSDTPWFFLMWLVVAVWIIAMWFMPASPIMPFLTGIVATIAYPFVGAIGLPVALVIGFFLARFVYETLFISLAPNSYSAISAHIRRQDGVISPHERKALDMNYVSWSSKYYRNRDKLAARANAGASTSRGGIFGGIHDYDDGRDD